MSFQLDDVLRAIEAFSRAVAAQVDGRENLAWLATLLAERAEVERASGDRAAAAR